MEDYTITLLLLCTYGFFKELRPSEPYLTDYLVDWKQLSIEEVSNAVYPVWPYSYFGLLVPVFLLTDWLRYKPVIVFEGVAYIATWSLLLWANGVQWMQVMEFTYGIATSTEVAYYTYIYSKVPSEKYQVVSSYSRSAILFGKFMSGLLSQLLTSLQVLDYGQLNYISLAGVSLAFAISIWLPRVADSIYFHREETLADQVEGSAGLKRAAFLLWADAKTAYSNSYVLKWSVWVALASCGNFQIGNYIQTLWKDISEDRPAAGNDNEAYNGAVEAATTLMGALVVFCVGFIKLNWVKWGNLAIISVTGLSSALLFLMANSGNIWVAYVGYFLFRMSYQLLMTIASFQIVNNIPKDAFGLVFGVNIFAALGCQSLLTFVVNNQLEMEAKPQFVTYSIFFLAIFLCYSLLLLHQIVKHFRALKT